MSVVADSVNRPILIASKLVGLVRENIAGNVSGLINDPALRPDLNMVVSAIEQLRQMKTVVETFQLIFKIGWLTDPHQEVQQVHHAFAPVHAAIDAILTFLNSRISELQQDMDVKPARSPKSGPHSTAASSKSEPSSPATRRPFVWRDSDSNLVREYFRRCENVVDKLEALCNSLLVVKKNRPAQVKEPEVNKHNAEASSESDYWFSLQEIAVRFGVQRNTAKNKLDRWGIKPVFPLVIRKKDNRQLFYRWGDIQETWDAESRN